MIFIARGDGAGGDGRRGGADGSRRLGEGARGLARGPHLYSFRDEPLQRGRLAASFRGKAQVWDWGAAQRGRRAHTLRVRQLKRGIAFCFLPGCRRSRAGGSFAFACGQSFYTWRQDGVFDASSGVVHGSLQASRARFFDPKRAGSAVLVSYRPLALSQPSHFFRRCLL